MPLLNGNHINEMFWLQLETVSHYSDHTPSERLFLPQANCMCTFVELGIGMKMNWVDFVFDLMV